VSFASAAAPITINASTTAAQHAISLDKTGTQTFASATYGYAAQTALTVTVSNAGNQPTGTLAVALSGTNSNSFALSADSISSIAAGADATFTVAPIVGLAATTYTATVTVTGDNGISEQFDVSFTVTPKPITPLSPVLDHFGTWTGSGSATAKIDADHTTFVRLLKDGVEVDSKYYTITQGSTIITLSESYLKTLANGTHTFVAHFTDGRSENITMTVNAKSTGSQNGGTQNESTQNGGTQNTGTQNGGTQTTGTQTSGTQTADTGNPQTGDSSPMGLGIAALLLALGILCLVVRRMRRETVPSK
jgi:LPXTG-motif cell wall-anchored protein